MARREIEEINAGSMADIAFLLLIFFLVTTTIEVDAGIGRQLPLKLDQQVDRPDVEIIERNILEVFANSNDDLMVEGKLTDIEDLEEIVYDFYTANRAANDQNLNMPNYQSVDVTIAQTEIVKLQAALEKNPGNKMFESELGKWEAKLELCKQFPGGKYREMNKSSLIQLKNQAGTSYGLYMEIQNILKKVVNELRVEKCEELDWPNYFELDEKEPEDQEKIKMLRILVPERIIEAKIER